MSLQIRVQNHPQRCLAITTSFHALLFRQNVGPGTSAAPGRGAPAKSAAEFVELDQVDLTKSRVLCPAGYGTLGVINLAGDLFVCVVTAAAPVASVRPGENVQRIHGVDFYCLNNAYFDFNSHSTVEGLGESDYLDLYNAPSPRDVPVEHPCLALQKLLSDGTFYYSVDFDLTNRLQTRVSKESTFDIDSFDDGFLWNSYMIEPLLQFRSRLEAPAREVLDASKILTSAIRGYVSSLTVAANAGPMQSVRSRLPSSLTIISRLSCRRAGTRFNARGIDDDGNVANFVETETVYWFPTGLCFSFAQVRGSVPVFWEQAAGILPQQQKIQLTRSPEATQPAFDKHFEGLELKYGNIHVLNLLSESKPDEVRLTARYNYHIQHCTLNRRFPEEQQAQHAVLRRSQFDFHAEARELGYEAGRLVQERIRDQAEGFAYFLCDAASGPSAADRSLVVLQQGGVFRTNCLDCLDRTNLIQTYLSRMALESFFEHRKERAQSSTWARHAALWANNGDALSKIYAGTGALKSSFTRHGKMSLAGALADARKSATRMYMNNFADKTRQVTTDTLLGRLVDQRPVQLYDPLNDYVETELARRKEEFTTASKIKIHAGTFNLNGRVNGIREDLSPWLCPAKASGQEPPDIVAVGLQEIVELSPQQIMSTDPARRHDWERAIASTLNRTDEKSDYVLLRSGQLVGAALLIFVKSSVLKYIRNVEGSIKKTGLSGMAGNKGAVAIRFDFASTRLCFLTAHLAAGFANYDERNRDYQTVTYGLRFLRNRTIDDHDSVIWLGDFNYRIGLNNDEAQRQIRAKNLGALYQNDQLNLQMMAGRAFKYYSEAPIRFLPTYKYDLGTDNFDSSEKARIPAWCDRVVWKGENLQSLSYDTAPLRFSDHRPVYAIFECGIRFQDEARRAELSRELYGNRDALVGDDDSSVNSEDESYYYEGSKTGLPPASSDRHKWWLNKGLLARSAIEDEHIGQVPNPRRHSNPFIPDPEPDWILVGADEPQRGFASRRISGVGAGLSSSWSEIRSAGGGSSAASGSDGRSLSGRAPPSIPRKPAALAAVTTAADDPKKG